MLRKDLHHKVIPFCIGMVTAGSLLMLGNWLRTDTDTNKVPSIPFSTLCFDEDAKEIPRAFTPALWIERLGIRNMVYQRIPIVCRADVDGVMVDFPGDRYVLKRSEPKLRVNKH